MKTLTKWTLLALTSIILNLELETFNSFAQSPTLTSGHAPVVGDVFTYFTVSNMSNTGLAGANQTWDFTGLSVSTTPQSENWVTPASLDKAAKGNSSVFPVMSAELPDATMAMQEGAFYIGYYSFTNNKFMREAWVMPGFTLRNFYKDKQILFSYPFTFNSSVHDTYYDEYNISGVKGMYSGSSSIVGDGYGTLKLPSKTYNNVLRVKYTDTNKDSSSDGVFNQKTVIYSWYDATHKQPLLKITEVDGTIKSVLVYSSGPTVSMNELTAKEGSFNLYPNPVQEKCTVSYDVATKSNVYIAIYNLLGLKVREWNNSHHAVAGHYSKEINLRDIAKGIYIVDVSVNEGVSFRQKLVVE